MCELAPCNKPVVGFIPRWTSAGRGGWAVPECAGRARVAPLHPSEDLYLSAYIPPIFQHAPVTQPAPSAITQHAINIKLAH